MGQTSAPRVERTETVGIIGAGPAGLSAAEMLRHRGYRVHVYDRYDRVGVLLMYGIPGFRLEKSIVERRGKLLRDGGVHFHLNVDVGGEISFEDIRAKHDAILLQLVSTRRAILPLREAALMGLFQPLNI